MSFSPRNARAAKHVCRARGLCVFYALALALVATARAEDAVVLTARPGLCVLKDTASTECVMGVRLEWRGPLGDYCLHEAGVAEPLACWRQQPHGQHDAALASSEDVTYSLRRTPSEEVAAEISVRVLSVAQRRPTRHRRRHAWAPL